MPTQAVPGDVCILTKPIGTQIAVNVRQWQKTDKEKMKKLQGITNETELEEAFEKA